MENRKGGGLFRTLSAKWGKKKESDKATPSSDAVSVSANEKVDVDEKVYLFKKSLGDMSIDGAATFSDLYKREKIIWAALLEVAKDKRFQFEENMGFLDHFYQYLEPEQQSVTGISLYNTYILKDSEKALNIHESDSAELGKSMDALKDLSKFDLNSSVAKENFGIIAKAVAGLLKDNLIRRSDLLDALKEKLTEKNALIPNKKK